MLKKHLDIHTKTRKTIIKEAYNFKKMVAKEMSGKSYYAEDESSDKNVGNDGEEIANSLSSICVELSRVTAESDSLCGSNMGAIVEKDMLNDDGTIYCSTDSPCSNTILFYYTDAHQSIPS